MRTRRWLFGLLLAAGTLLLLACVSTDPATTTQIMNSVNVQGSNAGEHNTFRGSGMGGAHR